MDPAESFDVSVIQTTNDVRTPERAYLVVAAILAWAGLIIQLIAILPDYSIAGAIWKLLSYLTIITNLAVASFFTMRLLRPDNSHQRFINSPSLAGWVTANITFVGIAFAALLARLYHPEGLNLVANDLLHYVTPALGLAYWFIFLRSGRLQWTDPLKWSIYALVYGAYALIRGAITGYYPYPFLDLPTVGAAYVAAHIVGLYIVFCVLGWLFVYIDRSWPLTTKWQAAPERSE